jgi:5-methylcytosine-specific restriction endonuclease McrA
MLKQCSTCRVVKDTNEFHSNRTKKEGLHNQCKVCRALYCKKHKEEQAKRNRIYYNEHREEAAKYYKDHRDEIVKRQRIYDKEHKDEIAKRQRVYCQTDNGKLVNKKKTHNRRALAKNGKSDLTLEQWTNIIKKQSNRCNICHKQFSQKRVPTIDHIIPLSLSGNLSSENIQALCKSCNSSKNAKLDLGFIQTWSHK